MYFTVSWYERGRRAEWIVKERLVAIGFPVNRVAGSKGCDLVLGGFPVEVKLKSAVPKGLDVARTMMIEDDDYVAAPFDMFFHSHPMLVERRKITNWIRKLIPDGGLLIIHIQRSGEIIVSKHNTRQEILDYAKAMAQA